MTYDPTRDEEQRHDGVLTGAQQDEQLMMAYEALLVDAEGHLEGEDVGPSREGLLNTPGRAARAWRELTAGYHEDPPALTTFEATHDEVVVVAPIPFYSLCEHHLLPFHGRAYIAYLPGKRILGLSKFARVVNHFARRLQVQERLTTQIADFLRDGLQDDCRRCGGTGAVRISGRPCPDCMVPGQGPTGRVDGPKGLAVVLKAEHLCMSMRGAQVPGAITTTSVMRGAFRDKPEARAEVLGLMGVTR